MSYWNQVKDKAKATGKNVKKEVVRVVTGKDGSAKKPRNTVPKPKPNNTMTKPERDPKYKPDGTGTNPFYRKGESIRTSGKNTPETPNMLGHMYNPGTAEAMQREAMRKSYMQDYKSMLDDVKGRLQTQMEGFTPEERVALKEKYIPGIQAQQNMQLRNLARTQARRGVTGGAAFAQQDAIRRQALQARSGLERDVALRDFDLRREAQTRYQRLAEVERMGSLGMEMGWQQMDAAKQMEQRRLAYLQEMQAAAAARELDYMDKETRSKPPNERFADNLANDPWAVARDVVNPAYSIPREIYRAAGGDVGRMEDTINNAVGVVTPSFWG